VLGTAYPADRVEVIVADGMSDDGTRDIVREYAARDSRIKLLDNPKRILAAAWNTGIRAARGEIVMALNAHTTFPPDYIGTCVAHLETSPEAAYVGGVIRTLPQDDTPLGRALALAVSHPFGVGGSRFRTGTAEPIWADTAAFGGYRRSLFDEIGLFNEELVRSQDMELHLRLKKVGKRILLVPGMVGNYYTRTTIVPYLRYCFINGYWLTLPLRFSPHMLSARHSVPMLFVAGLAGSALAGLIAPAAWWVTAATGGAYAAANVGASAVIANERRDLAYLFLMPLAFSALHLLYGTGALVGLAQAVLSRRFWQNFRAHAVGSRAAQDAT
jgi:GT2 family glycosyltransferase